MKKHVFGKQLKRDTNERKALFKNLLTSLVIEERITTTEAKAKAIRAAADKLITKAKKGGPDAIRRLAPDVRYDAVEKLVKTLGPRFKDRKGGYTRIIKVGRRVADNAPQVVLEWVVKSEAIKAKSEKAKGKDKKEDLDLDAEVSEDKNKKEKQVKKSVETKSGEKKPAGKPSILKKLVTRQKKG
jgi:large subunit ribosomal protein L17